MIKKHIPNFVTSLNLFSGAIAIIYAGDEMLAVSALFIGIAALMDFLDGLVARILNVSSAIGKELDSLADVVSFGVAPGVIAFQLITFSGGVWEIFSINVLPYFGLIIPVFSALRLAQFNIDATQSESFKGLPVPANAILFASLPLILMPGYAGSSGFEQFLSLQLHKASFLIALVLVFSFLLIAPFRLFSLKLKGLSWRKHKLQLIFLLFSLVSLIVFNFAAVPVIITVYILMSLLFYREVN